MHPGLSVFLFQIIGIRHWKLKLKAQLGWKTRTLSHEEICSSKIHFHFVSKWSCKFFKIHSLRMMRCVKTRVLCWDATSRGVTASLIQQQAGLELGLCIDHNGYQLFWAENWVLSGTASTGPFSFSICDTQAALRFCRSDEVFLSLAISKTTLLGLHPGFLK